MVYVANLGDSRALVSCDKGKNVLGLSKDHKPNGEEEEKRIIAAGGKLYQ
jgi:protein phosphatase 2C family protein 2/3